MTTPFDLFLAQGAQKAAADAIVPGSVGMGPTPGVTGMFDSPGETATNSAIANQRAQIQAAALINPQADLGAGYSTPPAGVGPSAHMEADVKAAAIIEEAEKFASEVYGQWLQQKAAAMSPDDAVMHGARPMTATEKARGAIGDLAGRVGSHAQAGAARASNVAQGVAKSVGAHPLATGVAGAAAIAGVGGAAWLANRAQQLGVQAQTQEAGQARTDDAAMMAPKAASADPYAAGRQMALEALGLA